MTFSNRPIRIMFLTSSAEHFGSERALGDLATGLSDLGVETLVVLPSDGPAAVHLKERGLEVSIATDISTVTRSVTTRELVDNVRSLFSAKPDLVRLGARFRPDIVYSNTSHVLSGPALSRLCGASHVWHVREIERLDERYRRLLGQAFLASGTVVGISRAVLGALYSPRVLRRHLDERIHLVHDGIDLRQFVWRSFSSRHVDRQPYRLTMPGRITPWKGHDFAIDAVQSANVDVTLRILGSPTTIADTEWFDRRITPLANNSSRVTLQGTVDDPGLSYSDADFLIHASLADEPFGRTVVEAMASGVVPIVPDRGGPVEIVRPGIDGFFYERGKLCSLRSAIERAALSPIQCLDQMSHQGRARVTSAFSADRTAYEIFSRVLSPLVA